MGLRNCACTWETRSIGHCPLAHSSSLKPSSTPCWAGITLQKVLKARQWILDKGVSWGELCFKQINLALVWMGTVTRKKDQLEIYCPSQKYWKPWTEKNRKMVTEEVKSMEFYSRLDPGYKGVPHVPEVSKTCVRTLVVPLWRRCPKLGSELILFHLSRDLKPTIVLSFIFNYLLSLIPFHLSLIKTLSNLKNNKNKTLSLSFGGKGRLTSSSDI